MIAWYLFLKLHPEHATAEGRAQVVSELRRVAQSAEVQSVSAGAPADAHALAAWDLGACFCFASLDACNRFLASPSMRALHDEFLAPRVLVQKSWSFEA